MAGGRGPQGNLAERIRAGGAGLGGVVTPTGVGTVVAEGKQLIEVDGRTFLLERPIRADVAILKAHEADYNFNLTYRLTATNFNPVMALAADCIIAEPDEIVPVGVIPPDHIRTPGILVHHLIDSPIRWTRRRSLPGGWHWGGLFYPYYHAGDRAGGLVSFLPFAHTNIKLCYIIVAVL